MGTVLMPVVSSAWSLAESRAMASADLLTSAGGVSGGPTRVAEGAQRRETGREWWVGARLRFFIAWGAGVLSLLPDPAGFSLAASL